MLIEGLEGNKNVTDIVTSVETQCFDPDGRLVGVKHNGSILAAQALLGFGEITLMTGNGKRGVELRDFSRKREAVEATRASFNKRRLYYRFFDRSGGFRDDVVEPIDELLDLNLYNHQKLLSTLNERLLPFYELVQFSLDQGHLLGFNRHDIEHVFRVTKTALEVAELFEMDEQTKQEIVLIGMLHDVGNLVSRKAHPWVPEKFVDMLVPELQQQPLLREKVLRGIALHDERAANTLFAQICNDKSKYVDEHDSELDEFAVTRNVFGDAALAVIIGDKVDAANRERVTLADFSTILNGKALTEEDIHYFISALIKDSSKIELNDGVVTHTMEFSPGLEEHKCTSNVAVKCKMADSDKAHVPQKIHDWHRIHGVPHLWGWLAAFALMNGSRVEALANSLFALGAAEYRLNIVDQNSGMNVGIIIDREHIGQLRRIFSILQLEETTLEGFIGEEKVLAENSYSLPGWALGGSGFFRSILDRYVENLERDNPLTEGLEGVISMKLAQVPVSFDLPPITPDTIDSIIDMVVQMFVEKPFRKKMKQRIERLRQDRESKNLGEGDIV